MKYECKDDRMIISIGRSFRTLEEFLDEYKQSRKNKYLLLQEKKILIDDIPAKSLQDNIQNRSLTLLTDEEEIDYLPAEKPCQVVYEDAFLYIVHKEPGMIIHGGKDDPNCLNAFAARYQKDKGIHAPVRPIHRLDRDTTGLVLYSKIPFFQPWFDEQLKDKKIQRHYLAITRGTCKENTYFFCDEPIGKDRHQNGKYIVSQTGNEAHTDVTCLKTRNGYNLFRCILETGRTHQIRVHLSYHGYPIVNDPLYGIKDRNFIHMGLWADEVIFRNPVTKKKHRIHDIPNRDYTYFETEAKI